MRYSGKRYDVGLLVHGRYDVDMGIDLRWLMLLWGGWFRPRRYRYHAYHDDPYEIARERLARGEITVQEYDAIIEKLGKS